MRIIRAAMIGDVVGSHGIQTLETKLPELIKKRQIDFVTVNGENAAEGFGMKEADFRRIIAAGADVVTSGNHIWEKREFWPILENEKNMLRPANYSGAPGGGFVTVEKNNVRWLVINLQGREYMSAIDCPFQCFDKLVSAQSNAVIIVDFHAESSREKETLAYYVDGRVSLVAGTHTHVQTTDERVLPKGSGYITDLGMTGMVNSVIGMDPKICQERFFKQIQYAMKPAPPTEPGQMHGIIAEINADTAKAVSVTRF
jgi:metallophosphoesterase (TIGR00282 family)